MLLSRQCTVYISFVSIPLCYFVNLIACLPDPKLPERAKETVWLGVSSLQRCCQNYLPLSFEVSLARRKPLIGFAYLRSTLGPWKMNLVFLVFVLAGLNMTFIYTLRQICLYPKSCHKTILLSLLSGWSQIISHLTVLHNFLVKKIKINLPIIKSRPQEIIKAHKETPFYGAYNKQMDISSVLGRVH